MLYRLPTSDATASITTTITGRHIAHAPRDASQRAALAAQPVVGEVTLTKPTIIQCEAIARVSGAYVDAALRLKPGTRALVAKGELTLQSALKANGLLAAWLASTPEEQAALGVAVGVDKIWDAVISPSI